MRLPPFFALPARSVFALGILTGLHAATPGPNPAPAGNTAPFWDGKTLDGWQATGGGTWSVRDGILSGNHSRQDPEFGQLVSGRTFGDFTLRLKFRTFTGESGVAFRAATAGFSGVSGFLVKIDPRHDTGALYESNGRAWVVRPAPGQVKEWFHPGQWNELGLSVRGSKISVTINGQTSAEFEDEAIRPRGPVALQLHGAQDVRVEFKDLEANELPAAATAL